MMSVPPAPRIRPNFASIVSMLDGIEKVLLNLPAAAGEILREDALRQFQAGGIPGWAPLSKSTVMQKRRQGYPRLNRKGLAPSRMIQKGGFGPENILERTGALLSSWTDASDPNHVEEVRGGLFIFGSSLGYAPFHQSAGARKKLPRRPILITEQALEKITGLIEHAPEGGK